MQNELLLTSKARDGLDSVKFIYSDYNSAIVGIVEDRKELAKQVIDLENKNIKLNQLNDDLKKNLAIEAEVLGKERMARKHLLGVCALALSLHLVTLSYLLIKNTGL